MTTLINLLQNLPNRLDQEQVDVLVRQAAIRIERIVSTGQASPPGFWYDQPEQEWVVLLSGRARIELRDPRETRELIAGDQLLIAAHRPHRVIGTAADQPTVWLAVFFPVDEPA